METVYAVIHMFGKQLNVEIYETLDLAVDEMKTSAKQLCLDENWVYQDGIDIENLEWCQVSCGKILHVFNIYERHVKKHMS